MRALYIMLHDSSKTMGSTAITTKARVPPSVGTITVARAAREAEGTHSQLVWTR